jgi:hypothetical protein
MVVMASTVAAQLKTTIAIAAATIGQRRYCPGCHCIIVPPSHRRLCQQQRPLTRTTISVAAINRRFDQH